MAFTRSAVRSRLAPPIFAASGRFGWQASLRSAKVARRSPKGEDGLNWLHEESINFPNETYIGLADDLRKRMTAHNAGQASHTKKFKPWRLVTYLAFSDEAKAVAFERYLKSSSGPAFAKNVSASRF